MKIVINNNGERIPATLEVVDGVMIECEAYCGRLNEVIKEVKP